MGYGNELIKQAIKVILDVEDKIGIYAIVVDAKKEAKGFYEKYGFIKLLNKDFTYFLPLKTIKSYLENID